jgi:membrane associated rhomboid family serine protease
MRTILLSLLAVLSLLISMWCFGVLLVSCSGHPPYTAIGIWILPVSALGGGAFFYLAMILLPKKTFAFFISLVVVTVSIFVFSLIKAELTLYVEMPDWVGYVIKVFGLVVAIVLGILTYRKFSKRIIRH